MSTIASSFLNLESLVTNNESNNKANPAAKQSDYAIENPTFKCVALRVNSLFNITY